MLVMDTSARKTAIEYDLTSANIPQHDLRLFWTADTIHKNIYNKYWVKLFWTAGSIHKKIYNKYWVNLLHD